MATQKPLRFIYQAKNSRTGLTDVKAQIYVNGVAKATGASALVGTELAFGVYEIVVSAANITAWGLTQGSYFALEAIVDSATYPLETIFREELTVANNDEIDLHLTSQDTAIASIKTDTTATRADLETAASSLPNILAAINQIQNNAGFALGIPATMLKPASGANSYRLTEFIYNEKNTLIDADGNTVTVTVTNQSGADRSSYLTGYVAGTPGSAPAVRDAAGKYHVDIAIPSTAAQEQLNFVFSYAVSGASTARNGTSEIITDVQADGFALQSTLLDVQTRATDIQTKVNDSTIGLAAANTLQAAIKAQTDKIGDGTIGLSAIRSAITSLQTDVTSNVEGTGFVSSTDSLHQISLMLQALPISGGKAV